jgi:putative ATP-dependent endonuclease of OLD family
VLQRNPEALLAKLPIVCEGKTELGFAHHILDSHFRGDYRSRGIHPFEVIGGNSAAVTVCKKFIEAGISFSCVADDEGTDTGTWQAVMRESTCLRWDNKQCIEEVVFGLVPDEQLLEIPDWAESINYRERRHLIPEIKKALGDTVTEPESEWLATFGRSKLLATIVKVAVPPGSRGKGWFKSVQGGRFLAAKMLEFLRIKPDASLQQKLDSFFTAVRQATE